MEIVLIIFLTLQPPTEGSVVAPQATIEVKWPATMGGLAECKAFKEGASIWHPEGDLYAVGNCIERAAGEGG